MWRTGGEVKLKLANGVVASTLHTSSEHGVSSITTITTADAHTSAASSRLNWRPHRFKWTRPFRRKTKNGFCACAITFQLACTGRGRKVQKGSSFIARICLSLVTRWRTMINVKLRPLYRQNSTAVPSKVEVRWAPELHLNFLEIRNSLRTGNRTPKSPARSPDSATTASVNLFRGLTEGEAWGNVTKNSDFSFLVFYNFYCISNEFFPPLFLIPFLKYFSLLQLQFTL
jgi:hypothetical protein